MSTPPFSQSARVDLSKEYRRLAAEKAKKRAADKLAETNSIHLPNPDETALQDGRMSFTKGLEHDPSTGRAAASDFKALRDAIDKGRVDSFSNISRLSPASLNNPPKNKDGSLKPLRRWEAPTSGFSFDLEGPDAQAVTMPPAPAVTDDTLPELAYEMAEVYELAILRDIPFSAFSDISDVKNSASKAQTDAIGQAVSRMNGLTYKPAASQADNEIRRPRTGGATQSAQTIFRGSSPGCAEGPYISQLMLLGNGTATEAIEGMVRYGAQLIDQRVRIAKPNQDFMTTWDSWLDVQNGADTRDDNILFDPGSRFIATPRDLATYVHDDALYQAYLTACLALLGMGTPTDPAFDKLSGADGNNHIEGFALFGGPHILSLLTEVATRALKAVRYQKFNVHLRLRPEALAARIDKAEEMGLVFKNLRKETGSVVTEVEKINGGNALLPMAFQEGSPMHPTYGAGHATVAGACVTMLKAFFDTSSVLLKYTDKRDGVEKIGFVKEDDSFIVNPEPIAFLANSDGSKLEHYAPSQALTLNGELNKLAANISIGRNMAGVHYFSDYYDSVRMGEEISVGILEEQAGGYTVPPFAEEPAIVHGDIFRVCVETFDGVRMCIPPENALAQYLAVKSSKAKVSST